MYNIDNVTAVSWDWKESPGEVARILLENINELLERKGLPRILSYDDPQCEGSDQFGFILSTDELTDDEVELASHELADIEYDPDMDEFENNEFEDDE